MGNGSSASRPVIRAMTSRRSAMGRGRVETLESQSTELRALEINSGWPISSHPGLSRSIKPSLELRQRSGRPAQRRESLRSRHPYRSHRPCDAEYLHDPLQIVYEYVQTHLGADLGQSLREEVCRPHPVFELSKDVFDGA